jgi:hypothetical protein
MIKRYDLERLDYEHYDMVSQPNGDFVLYEDYESLLEDYQSLCSKIRDLYLETP